MNLSFKFKNILAASCFAALLALSSSQQLGASNSSPFVLTQFANQPNGVPYPTKEWAYGQLPNDKKAALDAIINPVFATKETPLGESRAILIIQGGKIIYEKYGQGFDKESKLISWSMAKSFTAALFGILEKDGKINRNQAIADPHWRENDKRSKITYAQALQMSDGLNWREITYDDPINNDAALMLFGKGRDNIVKYATSRPLKYEAGTVWNYSSGTTNIIAAGISRAIAPRDLTDPLGEQKMRNFMFDRLFHPIGMYDTAAEFDANGNFYGSSMIYASAQDYARFGLLMARGGMWEGKEILTREYVNFMRTPAVSKGAKAYGGHFWLSLANKEGLLKNGPYDSFEAQGHEGQVIMIIPSRDLVIVRLGLADNSKLWDELGNHLQKIVDTIG